MPTRFYRHARYTGHIVAVVAMTTLLPFRLTSQPTTLSTVTPDRHLLVSHNGQHPLPNGEAVPDVVVDGIGFIDLDQEQAMKLGITYTEDGDLIFGHTYLFKGRPGLDDAALRAIPFEEALKYGLRDSGIVEQIWANKYTAPLRPTSEFKPGVISSAWRYLCDDRGYKIASRYAPDSGNVRYSVSGVDYMWTSNQVVDEETMNSARQTALRRTWLELGEIAFEREINSWIPVRVPRPNVGSGGFGNVIFWCEPTPELLAALPVVAVTQLRLELMAIAGVRPGSERVVDTLRAWAETIIDRIDALGTVAMVPVSGQPRLTIDGASFGRRWESLGPVSIAWRNDPISTTAFDLLVSSNEPRNVSIELQSWSGPRGFEPTSVRLIKRQRVDSAATPLRVQIPFNVPSGIYQLHVTTNMNEKVTWRVLVERGSTPMPSGHPWPAPLGEGKSK